MRLLKGGGQALPALVAKLSQNLVARRTWLFYFFFCADQS